MELSTLVVDHNKVNIKCSKHVSAFDTASHQSNYVHAYSKKQNDPLAVTFLAQPQRKQ